MIHFRAKVLFAACETDSPITRGSVGIPVEFEFSPEWDGLSKIAVYRGSGISVDQALTEGSGTVPSNVLTGVGGDLYIGVYGRNAAGTIVMPTIWAKVGRIQPGAKPSGVDPTEPEPDWTAKVQATAENALAVAKEALKKAEEGGGAGLSDDVKQALLQLAQKVAYVDDQGQTYYNDLYNALYPPADLVSISATFNQGNTVVYDTASLDSLKPMLTVTAHFDDGSTASVVGYTLSGTLTAGTSTITVAYQGKTATFTVTVTHKEAVLTGISAEFTQGSHTVYSGDSLDTLKPYLVVSASWDDGTSNTVDSYTLSGTLTTGTSTITVAYGGKTDTFTVTVTERPVSLVSISAVFNQGSAVIYDTDALDSLKQYLVVTAMYSDSSTATVPSADYTLSGTLAVGTSTVTVSYGGKTDSFNVTVTERYYPDVVLSDTVLRMDGGTTETFSVKLAGQPTQSQKVYLIANGVTLSADVLTFTTQNWNTFQSVTVSADMVDDTTYAGIIVRNSDPLMTDTGISVTINAIRYEDVVDMTIPAGQVTAALSDFTTTAYQGGTLLNTYVGTDTNIKVPLSLDPNNKLFIGGDTFRNNTSIQYLELESGIKTMSSFYSKAFSGMTSLIGLKWRNSGMTVLGSFFKGDTAFKWWDGLTDCSDATGMSSFLSSTSGTYALEYLPDLSAFTKLTTLRSAFYGCTNLKKVFGLPTAYDSACEMTSAFYGCTSLERAVVGYNVTSASHTFRMASGAVSALKRVDFYTDVLTSTTAQNIFTGNTSGADVYAHNNTDTWATLSPYAQSGGIKLHDLSGGSDLPTIVTWGDSTTSEGTAWTCWPDRLQTKLGSNNFIVRNEAVSGEFTTSTSARQGGNTLKIINGITIPASGSVNILASNLGTRDGQVFLGPNVSGGGVFRPLESFNPCVISGVTGVLRGNGNDYVFTRSEAGNETVVPAGTYVYSAQDAELNNSNTIMLINLGINSGWGSSSQVAVASELLAQTQYMVDHFLASGGTKYIVCGPSAGKFVDPAAKYYSEVGRTATLEYESLAATAFGSHWLNLREYGIQNGLSQNGLTPTAEDNERISNGVWPIPLLKGDDDYTHPSAYGANTQMLAFYEKGVALGYWS